MVIYVVGICAGMFVLAWKFWPVGKLYGRKIVLGDLVKKNTLLHLAHQHAEVALKSCLPLPPQQRLLALLEIEKRYGSVFQVGDHIRKGIVATGVDGATRHFRRILNTGFGSITITSGVAEALKTKAAQEDFRVQAFKFLVDGLDRPDMFSISSVRIPGLLLDLDEAWALRILRSSGYLSPSHELFGGVLNALVERGIDLDRELLDSWRSSYQGRELGGDEGNEYVVVLKLLHSHDHQLAEELLEKLMREKTHACEEAAEALLVARDLPHPVFSLSDLKEKVGLEGLSLEERTVWLVSQYCYLINWGGLAKFEEGDNGNLLVEMRDALQAIGAVGHVARVVGYIALYGPDGVPTTELERERFIEAAGSTWRARIQDLEDSCDRLEHAAVLAMQYEIEHSAQFRKRSEIKELLAT